MPLPGLSEPSTFAVYGFTKTSNPTLLPSSRPKIVECPRSCGVVI